MKEKQILAQLTAKCGTANLVAGGLLILGWYVFTALAIQIPFTGKLTFTFYQVLDLLNSSNFLEAMDRNARSGAGIYGLLALIALAAPFVHLVWKDKRAVLGGLVPLLFMLIVWIMVGHGTAQRLRRGCRRSGRRVWKASRARSYERDLVGIWRLSIFLGQYLFRSHRCEAVSAIARGRYGNHSKIQPRSRLSESRTQIQGDYYEIALT